MKVLEDKNISHVPGFEVIGVNCGLKKRNKKDLCIIHSKVKAVSAGTFTKNKVKAAPVLLNMDHIKHQNTQAIVINSANANACTGSKGILDAYEMASITASLLNLKPKEVLVSSTGIIGLPLPMEKIKNGISKACESLYLNDGISANEAILTTDTFTKSVFVQVTIDNKIVSIGGMAKGSGMIHPNMGTMLSFIATDANISKEILIMALKDSTEKTYNMVSVDGDTSTNDMAIVLANGEAKNSIIANNYSREYKIFKEALDYVNTTLAKLIAKDGEGATKLIEICTLNARTYEDAKLIAKSVISSSLVKTALFGSDANWGRILCAIGYSEGTFESENISISFKNNVGSINIVKDGNGTNFSEETVKKLLEQDYVNIIIDLNDGIFSAIAWGCDLSYEYIKINGDYRS